MALVLHLEIFGIIHYLIQMSNSYLTNNKGESCKISIAIIYFVGRN